MLDSKIDKSAFLNEDDVIEKMYYQENNEGGILSTLISR